MRWRHGIAAASIIFTAVFATAGVALADDCSGPGDCEQAPGFSSAATGLGIAGYRIDWALANDRVALVAAAPVPSSDHPVVVVSVTPGSP